MAVAVAMEVEVVPVGVRVRVCVRACVRVKGAAVCSAKGMQAVLERGDGI